MRARKVKEAYECPACGEFHEGAPEWVRAWRVVDLNDDDLTTTEPEVIDAAVTECGERRSPPTSRSARRIECEQVYLDREEAAECCR